MTLLVILASIDFLRHLIWWGTAEGYHISKKKILWKCSFLKCNKGQTSSYSITNLIKSINDTKAVPDSTGKALLILMNREDAFHLRSLHQLSAQGLHRLFVPNYGTIPLSIHTHGDTIHTIIWIFKMNDTTLNILHFITSSKFSSTNILWAVLKL